jgi:RNA polymerase sigma-70 factor (ECF subfamily)
MDDAALLETFRSQGDAGAFEALVDRYQAALLRHARALLGDRSRAEDVVQEAFLRLVQRPPELPSDGAGAHLAAWLHRVTRNLCMDAMRAETRRTQREAEVASKEATRGGLDTVEARDTRAAVEQSLAKLPGDQSEVLMLRLLAQRSYREIAEITGKKIGTVGWLVSTGLRSLAADLEPLLEGLGRMSAAPSVADARAGRLHGESS